LGTTDDPNYQTFRQIYVEVQLTTKGLDYVRNLINTKTSLSTNKWIKILTAGLLIVSAIALIPQWMQAIQGWQKDKRHKQRSQECVKKLYRDIQDDSVAGHNKASSVPFLNDSTISKRSNTPTLTRNPINKSTKPK
jgi:cytoskeletal protein RodZ